MSNRHPVQLEKEQKVAELAKELLHHMKGQAVSLPLGGGIYFFMGTLRDVEILLQFAKGSGNDGGLENGSSKPNEPEPTDGEKPPNRNAPETVT